MTRREKRATELLGDSRTTRPVLDAEAATWEGKVITMLLMRAHLLLSEHAYEPCMRCPDTSEVELLSAPTVLQYALVSPAALRLAAAFTSKCSKSAILWWVVTQKWFMEPF